ncbi:MAG: hypothetical protein LC131_04525 [Anaerolineae bacterium]|nr:hypothetical protein [Anaerolineae bacterium]
MKFNIDAAGNLVISRLRSEKADLQEMLEKCVHKDHGFLADLLEYTGRGPNGHLDQVAPEDIGALTDAPILTDDLEVDDQGVKTIHGRVWWFPNYQIESFAETLIKTGNVTFQLVPEEPAAKAA